jgi:hypothetical protein
MNKLIHIGHLKIYMYEKKSLNYLKMPKGKAEDINQRRKDNTMVKK